jgi:hypothetical protein
LRVIEYDLAGGSEDNKADSYYLKMLRMDYLDALRDAKRELNSNSDKKLLYKILNGEGNPSDKFWKLEKRIKEDKKDCGVQCEMSRSNQFYIMLSLLNEGAITMEDLEEFSDDLKDTIGHFAAPRNR